MVRGVLMSGCCRAAVVFAVVLSGFCCQSCRKLSGSVGVCCRSCRAGAQATREHTHTTHASATRVSLPRNPPVAITSVLHLPAHLAQKHQQKAGRCSTASAPPRASSAAPSEAPGGAPVGARSARSRPRSRAPQPSEVPSQPASSSSSILLRARCECML